MSVFIEIADQWATTDAALATAEEEAFQDNDDAVFDRAGQARERNDQAYFLYLFTRFEAAVDAATTVLLATRLVSAATWSERRIWEAWSRRGVRDIALMSKVEVLTEKGRPDYARVAEYRVGRDTIAHGGQWQVPFFVPGIAETMRDLEQRFVTS